MRKIIQEQPKLTEEKIFAPEEEGMPTSEETEEFLVSHQIDIRNAYDLGKNEADEAFISTQMVEATRNSLGLDLESFAVLLGIDVPTLIRYEHVSMPPYPTTNTARKIGLLVNWLSDEKSGQSIVELMGKTTGLATLSGLLQAESVNILININASLAQKQARLSDEPAENIFFKSLDDDDEEQSCRGPIIGNA
jgi:transcriptional regulator with XRE-family HTH domain